MEFTAAEIAQFVHGTVDGDGAVRVSDFAKIEEGRPGTLTFLANPKYTHHIYTTNASVVLVANDFVAEQPLSATLIRVANPYETLSQLMQMVAQATSQHPTGIEQPCHIAAGVQVDETAYVGAFTYIAEGVKLGRCVKIYPQVYIGKGVEIGDDTVLYPGVKVYYGSKIGKRCVLHSGVVVGSDGFGFAPDEQGHYHKIPQLGIAEIGDDVEIGANTTVDRSTMGKTSIGKGTKLDNLIQVAHNAEIGEHTVMAAQSGLAGSTKVGSHCMIGGQVGFGGHIKVGDHVQIGAQSGIANDWPDGSRIMGSPAVDARSYMRQVGAAKRLPDIFDAVRPMLKKNK